MSDRSSPASAGTQAEAPSKSQKKRDMQALQRLGAALTQLSDDRLEALALPETLREAIAGYRHTRSHEGRRRQMQYIGKLMRGIDAEPLREAVAAAQLGGAREALSLHEAERWRDALIASDTAIGEWVAAHPASDGQHLRSLVRAARKDAAGDEAPGAAARKGRAYRELFRFIRQDAPA